MNKHALGSRTTEKLNGFFLDIEHITIEYFRKNYHLIVLAFTVAICAYGYELFNFSLSIDEPLKMFDAEKYAWIKQGRWGTFMLLQLFMPESLIPFFPTLISVVFLVLSAILFLLILEGDNISKCIFLLLFISFPSTSYFLEFNTFNFSVSVGFFLVFCSIICLKFYIKKKQYKYLFYSSLPLACSLGVYQSLITLWLAAFFVYLFSLLIKNDGGIKNITGLLLCSSLALFFSLFLYKGIDLLFRYIYEVDAAYLNHFVGWKSYEFRAIFDRLTQYILEHFSGKIFYGEKTLTSIWFVSPILLIYLFKKKEISTVLSGFFCWLGILISPFLLSIVLGSPLPTRSLVGLPLLIGGVWYLASCCSPKIFRYFLLIAAIFIATTNSYSNNRLFFSDYLTWQADRNFANRILDRIYNMDLPQETKKRIPISILGEKKYISNAAFIRAEVFGASFFEWEGGNPYRILSFFETLGVQEFRPANNEEYQTAIALSKDMPNWPHKKSIFRYKNMIVLKLSEPTQRQLQRYSTQTQQ